MATKLAGTTRPTPAACEKKKLQISANFLYSVYKCSSKYNLRKILDSASESELDSLITTIKFVLAGTIPIRQNLWKSIIKSKKVPYLTKTFKISDLRDLLALPREDKIGLLVNVSKYRELLHNMFEK